MAITYAPATNKITVVGEIGLGDTEATAVGFLNLWNADKAGSLQLKAPTVAALDLSLTTQPKPAESVALKLNLNITLFSVAGNVILTGLDKDGNAQTETISITADGTYVSAEWWKSIDSAGIDCTGTYTIEITQSRWGVVWKLTDVAYIFDANMTIGNGSITTWFVETKKQPLFRAYGAITVVNFGHLRFGEVLDADKKLSKNGITLFYEGTSSSLFIQCSITSGTDHSFEIYSSYFYGGATTTQSIVLPYNGKIWNCLLDRFSITHYLGAVADVYDVRISQNPAGSAYTYPSGTIDKVFIYNNYFGLRFYAAYPTTISNVISKNTLYRFLYCTVISTDKFLINVDSDNSTIYWAGTSTKWIYKQYEYEVTVKDKDGNPIQDVIVTATYQGAAGPPGSSAFSDTTNVDGNLTNGVKTLSHGYFKQSAASTEQLKAPIKIEFKKAGYKTIVKYYLLTEKTKDSVVMQKAVDIIFVDGKPVLSLSAEDPDNELYMEM